MRKTDLYKNEGLKINALAEARRQSLNETVADLLGKGLADKV